MLYCCCVCEEHLGYDPPAACPGCGCTGTASPCYPEEMEWLAPAGPPAPAATAAEYPAPFLPPGTEGYVPF